jgi:hypothetical protein
MRPLSHCIARGLQLLNINAFSKIGNQAAYSSICMTKFISSNRSTGLPSPNRTLSDSPGLSALFSLFSTFINGKEGVNEPIKKQRLEFMQILSKLYGGNAQISDKDFTYLINKYDSELCRTLGLQEERISLKPNQFKAARAGVEQLWKIQAQHTKKMEDIIKLIFVVDKTGKLHINPSILSNGIQSLEQIAAKVREQLILYYGNCETTYQDAVASIRKN